LARKRKQAIAFHNKQLHFTAGRMKKNTAGSEEFLSQSDCFIFTDKKIIVDIRKRFSF
jgi:hypothetical protein